MRSLIKVVALAFLVPISPEVLAQIVPKNGGYLISIKYKKGQVIKQALSMNAVGNTKLKSTSEFITKCIDVDSKGTATLEVLVKAGGKTPPTKKKVKVDRHGKPIGATIDGFSSNFVWPDKPVKIGETWRGDITLAGPGPGAGSTMQSGYKLAAIKVVDGVKVACIAASLSLGGSFDISGDGMIYVKVSDGQLQSATFNMALRQFSESNTHEKLKLLMTIRTEK
jgi:hypothetical protein